ncbi:S-layer homology domain-containing protein [Cytobacillus sp. S13-E01]|uniref:S-layer homology domain-containing protein n=1 Tax=Cytobacillus sp. S13-E01 TaxID=3031326 RepID=UPI0023D7F714|nr:S-layer homology domain-containing protein [Cytobacillus sp. S13-E01]MDF0726042.1 S-layer homology domain-containing protein [Cytobacillus sp. S13-E01]
MKRIFSMMIAVLMLLTFTVSTTTYAAKDDITGNTLEVELRAMIERGVINGFEEGVYKPSDPVTRAQFAAFLSRALTLPVATTHTTFSDVPASSSLAKTIYSANQAGLVQGFSDKTFKPDDKITREQMAIMIDRALLYKKIARVEAPLTFTDSSSINATFKQGIAHNVHFKIINGMSNGDGSYRFGPKENATRAHAAAFIYRMLQVIEAKPEQEPEPEPEPKPEPSVGYKVATIDSNGKLVFSTTNYISFETANAAIRDTKNQVVTLDSKIVKMSNGVVYAKPSLGSSITLIYAENMVTQIGYLPTNAEMGYIDADENKVKVQLADKVGYVKHTDVTLYPDQMLGGRSYYMVNKGELVHYIYNPGKSGYDWYLYGAAPTFLQEGKTYYSWDGDTFVDAANGNEVGQAHQYFNYLPLRTKTSYTAEQLNAYIANVKPESPLKDLGSVFIEAQEKYNVNAMYLLAHAIHESTYGTSEIAQKKFNLFGLKATDAAPGENAQTFSSFEESIMYAGQYVSNQYLDPAGKHFNGAVLGNKARGMNVRYASDPYWGQKIAGHMYRIDKALKGNERGLYTIGENTEKLNVRIEPNTQLAAQFTYPNEGFPFVLLETSQQTDGMWYKTISDSNKYTDAYVHGDYVRELPVVK